MQIPMLADAHISSLGYLWLEVKNSNKKHQNVLHCLLDKFMVFFSSFGRFIAIPASFSSAAIYMFTVNEPWHYLPHDR